VARAGVAAPGEYEDGESAPDYYLPGGAVQVYIAPANTLIGGWAPNSTPWVTPPAASPAASVGAAATASSTASSAASRSSAASVLAAAPTAAPAPALTSDGLSQQLGRLSALLGTIAAEGARKGVRTSHIRFQAERPAKLQARLTRYATASSQATGSAPIASAILAPGDNAAASTDAAVGAANARLRAAVHSLTGLARHVHTFYPWSVRTTEATDLFA
jgi:hypothetical protein